MALEIATIPVLTEQVAENFEAQATKAYKDKIDREGTGKTHRSSYERGVNMVKEILSHSNL